jgi:hypothetical protein
MVPAERRRGYRYPITATAELRLVRSEKQARAVIRNISSRGVFFSTEIDLDKGEPVELLIDWPVRLNDRIPLALVLLGTVRRSDSIGTAVMISRYEWKIRARTMEPKVEINLKRRSQKAASGRDVVLSLSGEA